MKRKMKPSNPKQEKVVKAFERIEMPFTECDTCRAKAGSPQLCNGCLMNRQVINVANEYINQRYNELRTPPLPKSQQGSPIIKINQ